MKNFCIITNKLRDERGEVAQEVKEILEGYGAECVVLDNVDKDSESFCYIDPSDIPDSCECVIGIGGDGTLLHIARELKNLDVNFVGLNKGNLGFLTEITTEHMEEELKKLVDDEFEVESRMMLKATLERDGKIIERASVLNDVVIHRGAEISVVNFDVYVNGELLGNYRSDGILLATPTGSTGYNISAGGPLARPDSHLIILTPICNHSAGSRSLIFTQNDEIEIVVGQTRKNDEEPRVLAFDGNGKIELQPGDKIKVSTAEEATKIIKIDEVSFLQSVRNKLK